VTRPKIALLIAALGIGLGVPASAEAKLRFRNCEEGQCARLSVPLDHSGVVSGRLSLRVERHDSYHRVNRGFMLVLAGWPGQAGSRVDEYTWESPGRDLIMFDQRGTGAGALRCRDLEAATPSDAGREAAACATLLGDSRAFFGTDDTVEDIEELRVQLGLERLTIVGSAYGAYVAQRYALRHPDRVERLLLEGPVDAAGVDVLYVDSMAAVRRALPARCRSGCGSFTRDTLADTARLVERLASEPLRGTIVGPRGQRRTAVLTGQELLHTLVAGDRDFLSASEYPAAVASALRGDPAPILRMKRRGLSHVWSRRPGIESAAAYALTMCEEARFPWSRNATPAERDEAAYRAETAIDRSLVAPFDPASLVRSDLMRLCRRWPTVSPVPPPDPSPMPDVPVLVLSGPDSVRTSLESARRTAERFPNGHLLEIPGLAPAAGFGLSRCADRAAQRFLGGRPVQQRCAREGSLIPPARPAPRSLSELAPERGVPGRPGRLLRAFSVTYGDLLDSFYSEALNNIGLDVFDGNLRAGGLRGGSFALTRKAFRFDRYEYVPGVRFSSRWTAESNGVVVVRVDGPGSLDGVIRISEADDDLTFRVRGRLAGQRVRAQVPVRSRLLDLLAVDTIEGETARGGSLMPMVPGHATGSCRLPLLRDLPGACAVR
jgi:pimeloyl-ACP methyl ester carboxylesterase